VATKDATLGVFAFLLCPSALVASSSSTVVRNRMVFRIPHFLFFFSISKIFCRQCCSENIVFSSSRIYYCISLSHLIIVNTKAASGNQAASRNQMSAVKQAQVMMTMRQFSTTQLPIRLLAVASILLIAVFNILSYHLRVSRSPHDYYWRQTENLPRLMQANSTIRIGSNDRGINNSWKSTGGSTAQNRSVDPHELILTTTVVVGKAASNQSSTIIENPMLLEENPTEIKTDIRPPRRSNTTDVLTVSKAYRTVKNMNTDRACPLLTDPNQVSVSLVIHSTLERLWLMEETCRRWTGPIVLVVYYKEGSDKNHQPWRQVLDWPNHCPQVKLVPVKAGKNDMDWKYPVNKLRNIGLDALETPLFLMMDVDFLPSENLEAAILHHFFSTSKYYSTAKRWHHKRIAMVVPAFERMKASCNSVQECQQFLKDDPHFMPRSFSDIVECVNVTNCSVFQESIFLDGHYTTGSESWLKGEFYQPNANQHRNIPRRIPCFHSYRYEPYIVLQWCGGHTPYYDERFYGYGKNKIQYISHLRFLNYTFHVLPEGFLTHHPHKKSEAHSVFRVKDSTSSNKSTHREQMDRVYLKFLQELKKIYGKSTVNQCVGDVVYEERVKKIRAKKAIAKS
jgi:hypothetical protein